MSEYDGELRVTAKVGNRTITSAHVKQAVLNLRADAGAQAKEPPAVSKTTSGRLVPDLEAYALSDRPKRLRRTRIAAKALGYATTVLLVLLVGLTADAIASLFLSTFSVQAAVVSFEIIAGLLITVTALGVVTEAEEAVKKQDEAIIDLARRSAIGAAAASGHPDAARLGDLGKRISNAESVRIALIQKRYDVAMESASQTPQEDRLTIGRNDAVNRIVDRIVARIDAEDDLAESEKAIATERDADKRIRLASGAVEAALLDFAVIADEQASAASPAPTVTGSLGGGTRAARLAAIGRQALEIDPAAADRAGAPLDALIDQHLPDLVAKHALAAGVAPLDQLGALESDFDVGLDQVGLSLDEALGAIADERISALRTQVAFLRARRGE